MPNGTNSNGMCVLFAMRWSIVSLCVCEDSYLIGQQLDQTAIECNRINITHHHGNSVQCEGLARHTYNVYCSEIETNHVFVKLVDKVKG